MQNRFYGDPHDQEDYAFGGWPQADNAAEEAAERAEDSFDRMVGDAGKVTFKVAKPAPRAYVERPKVVTMAEDYGWQDSYSARYQQQATERVAERDYNAPTDKQVAYLDSLIASKGTDMHRLIDTTTVTKWDASRLIDELVKVRAPQPAPAPVVKPQPLPAVPAGRYAVEQDGVLRFYRLDCPTEGKWAGYTFLKVQASDEFWPIKDAATKTQVLSAIAADPRAALERYGKELGVCGICGRTLTDEESRSIGIGPVCIEKGGW